MNNTNDPQKSKFQNKGGEESDKVKENIPEALSGNRTTVVIRVRIEAIKGRGEAKGGDLKNREEKRSIKKKNHPKKEGVKITSWERESYLL